MLNNPLDEHANLTINGRLARHTVHSIPFYISALIVVVLTTGSLIIFGLSAFNRVEPVSNTTDILRRPTLPPTSNESTKSSKDTNGSEVQIPP
jgi:hypothetical protein